MTRKNNHESSNRAASLERYILEAKSNALKLGITWGNSHWLGFGVFVKQEFTKSAKLRHIPPAYILDEAYLDFAKAYIVERHLQNPNQSRSMQIERFAVVRLIEAALGQKKASFRPEKIDWRVLNAAAELARSIFGAQASRYGSVMEVFAKSMVDKGLLPLQLKSWRSPIAPKRDVGSQVGGEGDKARAARLPDTDAMGALIEIFNKKFDLDDERLHRDIYTTSVFALLSCAPSRVQEIHRLPSNLMVTGADRLGEEHLGLRLEASKGFGAYVKWVWKEMADVAERAIARMTKITDEARGLARHIENESTTFFRHTDCPEVGDEEPLTAIQVCQALGLRTEGYRTALWSAGLSSVDRVYTLNSLWSDWVVPQNLLLHPHFPYVTLRDKSRGKKGGLKFSEALFCMRARQLSPSTKSSRVLLWIPNLATFGGDVAQCPSAKGRRTIFERYGYVEEGGRQLRIGSHQIRHLLNTEAQRVGVSDELVAKWSGRLNISQNAVYDNRPERERVEQVRGVIEALDERCIAPKLSESDSRHWRIAPAPALRSLEDLKDIQPRLVGLKTQYGECYHDWALAPCEGFIKCLDCCEHACIKDSSTDGKKVLERLEALRAQVLSDIEKSREAVARGDWGATDWLATQERYFSKLAELIGLLNSKSVPEFAVIRLSSSAPPDHLTRVLRTLELNPSRSESLPLVYELGPDNHSRLMPSRKIGWK